MRRLLIAMLAAAWAYGFIDEALAALDELNETRARHAGELHIDGGSTNILSQSDDGTTDTAPDATGSTISAGSAVANRTEVWIDGRDKTAIKFYIDGALKNNDVNHTLAAAVGPLGLLVLLEKTTGTATANYVIDHGSVRFQK